MFKDWNVTVPAWDKLIFSPFTKGDSSLLLLWLTPTTFGRIFLHNNRLVSSPYFLTKYSPSKSAIVTSQLLWDHERDLQIYLCTICTPFFLIIIIIFFVFVKETSSPPLSPWLTSNLSKHGMVCTQFFFCWTHLSIGLIAIRQKRKEKKTYFYKVDSLVS